MSNLIHNYALIGHATQPHLLLLKNEQSWTLPEHQATDAQDINQSMKDLTGLETTVLYCAYDQSRDDDEHEETHQVYALENHSSPRQEPTIGAWVSHEALFTMELVVEEHRPVIETWFREQDPEMVSPLRRPWARPGWFAIASTWLREQLPPLGYEATGPVRQVSVAPWSTVLCIPTNRGDLYFKASDPVFPYEPRLTHILAQYWPTLVPPVLTVDRERAWMLMQDVGTPLSECEERNHNPRCWEDALMNYALLQIEAAEHVEDLLAAGCPDRRLATLPRLLAQALADIPALMIGEEGGLREAEWERLQNIGPELKALATALSSYQIPETLHHDDLHAGNIAVQGEKYILFDWAESFIAHPFFSLVVVQRYAKYVLNYDRAQLDRLRDAYLTPWTAFEPLEHLHDAFELAQRLGKLCRALTWYNYLCQMEPGPRQSYASSWPYWLQLFLGTEE